MSSAPTAKGTPPPHDPSVLAGFLSYLIPGLGQMYLGKVSDGIKYLLSVSFFYGLMAWAGMDSLTHRNAVLVLLAMLIATGIQLYSVYAAAITKPASLGQIGTS